MSPDLQSDTHMHSTHSDGSATIAAMAEAAFEKGMTTIAITDYVPLPFDTHRRTLQQIMKYLGTFDLYFK